MALHWDRSAVNKPLLPLARLMEHPRVRANYQFDLDINALYHYDPLGGMDGIAHVTVYIQFLGTRENN